MIFLMMKLILITEIRFDSVRYVDGIGGNSTDSNRDTEIENGGWRTFSGYIFVQEPDSIASNGSNISELPYQITIVN